MPDIVARFVDCHVFRLLPDGTDEWLVLKRAPHVIMGGAWGMVQAHVEAQPRKATCQPGGQNTSAFCHLTVPSL